MCSPGAIATVFGAGLSSGPPEKAEQAPATRLNGLRVKANGDYIPILYASATQVNFLCPDAPDGTELLILVETEAGQSDPVTTQAQYAVPGIFTLDGAGEGQGAIFVNGTQEVAMVRNPLLPSRPAQRGDVVLIFASGLGPLSSTALPLVHIGETPAEVQAAGAAPGLPGVTQVVVKVPANAPVGDQIPVSILVTLPDGRTSSSNSATIAIEELR